MAADVFISYSSRESAQAEELCRILTAASIEFWIDRERIVGGDYYGEEIVAAIKTCRIVILLYSKAFCASREVRQEIRLAWTENKRYLPLMIEPVEIPDDIRYTLEATHYLVLYGPQWDQRHTLVPAAVRASLAKLDSTAPYALRRVSDYAGHRGKSLGFVPLLVDRMVQQGEVAAEIERAIRGGASRPVLFLVHGAPEQCVEGFIERLQWYDLPRILKRVTASDQLQWHHCQWPPLDLPTSERLDFMRRELADCLDLAVDAGFAVIRDRIVANRLPIACSFHVIADESVASESELFSLLGTTWAGLPELTGPGLLMMFYCAKYQPLPVGLLRAMRGRQKLGNTRRALSSLMAQLPSAFSSRRLHELESVLQTDVEHWAREIVRPADIVAMIREIENLYADASLTREHRIAMEPLRSRLKELLISHHPLAQL